MSLTHRLVTWLIKRLVRILCRVHDRDLARVPKQGPLILTANHVNFLEVPLMYTHLHPRPMTAFAKVETWDSPLLGWLADLWGAIPLQRGEADTTALRAGLKALEEDLILCMAPEGTRSGDGRLQRGHPGIVLLALRSNAPLLPVAFYGGEQLRANLRRLRRTDFHIVVGRPFTLSANGDKVTREVRQQMADEIMGQIAALLPPAYRGAYSDPASITTTYLRFVDGDGGEPLRR